MTFLDSAGNGVLKMDTAERVRVSRERREQLLREFATSGISARRFAQLAGVNPVTFYSWVQKQRALGSETPVRSAESTCLSWKQSWVVRRQCSVSTPLTFDWHPQNFRFPEIRFSTNPGTLISGWKTSHPELRLSRWFNSTATSGKLESRYFEHPGGSVVGYLT